MLALNLLRQIARNIRPEKQKSNLIVGGIDLPERLLGTIDEFIQDPCRNGRVQRD